MSRTKKITRNCLIIIAFLLFYLYSADVYLTPLSAHKVKESSQHYGPSEIINIQNYNNGKGKYLLCKYGDWVSIDGIDKSMLFFWKYTNSLCFQIDKSKAIDFCQNHSTEEEYVFGIVNDSAITKVEAILNNGNSFTQDTFYDGLFIIIWPEEISVFLINLNGYDKDGNIIYTMLTNG